MLLGRRSGGVANAGR